MKMKIVGNNLTLDQCRLLCKKGFIIIYKNGKVEVRHESAEAQNH